MGGGCGLFFVLYCGVLGVGRGSEFVILVLCECIWNVPAASLILPQFSSEWSIPMVPPCVIASHFLVGNREVEMKCIIFSSFLVSHVFLTFLFF